MRIHGRGQVSYKMFVKHVLTLLVVVAVCIKSSESARFGGAVIDAESRGIDAGELLASRQWSLERKVGTDDDAKSKDPQNHALKKAASRLMNGSTVLNFTQERSELRADKKVVYFSSGEIGYWRVARGGTGGLLGMVKGATKSKKASLNSATDASEKGESLKSQQVLPYEEAVLAQPSTLVVEIEVLSNQAAVRALTRPNRNKREIAAEADQPGSHVFVYQIPIDFGRIQKGAIVSDVTGVVRLLPTEVAKSEIGGHRYSEHSDVLRSSPSCLNVGTANLKIERGRGLVDPTWGRGRTWFYKGRSKGIF